MEEGNCAGNNTHLVVCLPSSEKRSISPITPTRGRKLTGVRLFRAISRRLTIHRSRQHSRSPSSDSESSSSEETQQSSSDHRNSRNNKNLSNSSGGSSSNGDQNSNSGSDSGSGSSGGQTSSHNTSSSSNESSESGRHTSSIRRVFQSLSISQSGGRKGRPKKAPKKILRAPIAYTYVKGLSGLPTQRVPRGCPCTCAYAPLHAPSLFGLNR